jgi:hypothetical protein
MSAWGHELPRRPGERAAVMLPKAAAPSRDQGGRGGPLSDKVRRSKTTSYSITSSARVRKVSGIVN